MTETKQCQNCKKDFIIEDADFEFYKKMDVPPPTWCPECRLIRRLAWQGYRILYKRKCDFTGEMVISSHHPDSSHKVYRQDIWWSDKWDPRSYGKDYDFSRTFFEQYRDLLYEVPMPILFTEYTTMINSEYCNAAATLKKCYLCFKSDNGEENGYCNTMDHLKDCFDATHAYKCERSYELLNVDNCYQAFYVQNSNDCHDAYFSRDLLGCSDCIGCINLRNKSYHIFNKPYTKEEYVKKLKTFDFGSRRNVEAFKKEAEAFIVTQPRKAFFGRKNFDSSGDYLQNSNLTGVPRLSRRG